MKCYPHLVKLMNEMTMIEFSEFYTLTLNFCLERTMIDNKKLDRSYYEEEE